MAEWKEFLKTQRWTWTLRTVTPQDPGTRVRMSPAEVSVSAAAAVVMLETSDLQVKWLTFSHCAAPLWWGTAVSSPSSLLSCLIWAFVSVEHDDVKHNHRWRKKIKAGKVPQILVAPSLHRVKCPEHKKKKNLFLQHSRWCSSTLSIEVLLWTQSDQRRFLSLTLRRSHLQSWKM